MPYLSLEAQQTLERRGASKMPLGGGLTTVLSASQEASEHS